MIPSIGFDVDGTLISFEGKPNYEVIDLFLKFQKMGCLMVVASGGGKDYAKCRCNYLGITPNVITNKRDLNTVDVWFDDEVTNIGKVNIQIKGE